MTSYKTNKSDWKEISFDVKLYKELKKSYEKAVKDNKETFIFMDNEWLTKYAKYVLQYLEMQGIGKGDKK